MDKGDVVINPKVSKMLGRKLNPRYALINVGGKCFMDLNGQVHVVPAGYKYKRIGRINLKKVVTEMIEKAEQKEKGEQNEKTSD